MKKENKQDIINTDVKSTVPKTDKLNLQGEILKLKERLFTGIQRIDDTYDLSVRALENWDAEEKRKIEEELTEIKEKYSPDVIDVQWEKTKADMMKRVEDDRNRSILENQKLQDEINQLQQKTEQLLKGNKK